jgi:hypothetical protein
MDGSTVRGTGHVKCGRRDLGDLPYEIATDAAGHPSFVKFARPPAAGDGARLHLTLEDGRMLDCQVLDVSPYCAVIGEGPYTDRRSAER